MLLLISAGIFFGSILLLLAVLAIMADTGGTDVRLIGGAFIALTWTLPALIEGAAHGGLDALLDEDLRTFSIMALIAALVALTALVRFIRKDPLGKWLQNGTK
jgi:hypothetical protein